MVIRIAIIIFLIFAGLALIKSLYTQASKFKEIYQAEEKVSQLTQEQKYLQTLFEKQKSAFFLEKQARDKLGYQRPGEVLYVVLDQGAAGKEKENTNKETWEEWVDFLFR